MTSVGCGVWVGFATSSACAPHENTPDVLQSELKHLARGAGHVCLLCSLRCSKVNLDQERKQNVKHPYTYERIACSSFSRVDRRLFERYVRRMIRAVGKEIRR